MAASGLALPPATLAAVAHRRRDTARPYLELARECGAWIAAAARETEAGIAWAADPARPESIGLDFYNGTPGVVLFAAELARATGEPRWRRLARRGAQYLAAEMERADPARLDAGLYTGLGGLAFVFTRVEDLGDRAARDPGLRALALLRDRAQAARGGITWTGSPDTISGNAGTGLLLLEAHRRSGDSAWLDLAARAGRHLVGSAEPAGGGLMWFPGRDSNRNYPNFSHGTAGVAYFLATLHQRTGDPAFLDAALAGARYLDAIAIRHEGATTIHHHDGGGEDLFYLSWCHGPPGTARLFYRLHQITGDPRWRAWVDALTRGTLAAGVPERRSDGFWNNISQCCGNVGVGEFFLALARSPLGHASDVVRRVVDDTLGRGTRDRNGLRWVQAEHRVQPDNLVAQTGYMQGAAGVGTFLLRLDAHERGVAGPAQLPDSPFQV